LFILEGCFDLVRQLYYILDKIKEYFEDDEIIEDKFIRMWIEKHVEKKNIH